MRIRHHALTLCLVLAACSRRGTPPEGASAATPTVAAADTPVGTAETMPAHITLATKIEDAPDAGATATDDLHGKVVLHVGDSMVGGHQGLTKFLEAKFVAAGAKFVRDWKVSEQVVSFDKSKRLRELLDKHKPDIVIITLGANDVFVPYPQSLAPNVQRIAKRIAPRECVWMGPPTWKPDTGIVEVIRSNASPCRFFDGSSLKLDRGKDGIHPNDKGGAAWANAFWQFYRGTAHAEADAAAP
jgi:hypothetical protein